MDDIHKIIAHAKKNKKGFTAYYKDGKLIPVKGTKKDRYSVADKTAIVYIPHEKNIRVYHTPKDDSFIGGWYDKESKQYLIESINLYENRKKALDIARKRKQKAIFDLFKMNEIPLVYKQKVSGIRIQRKKRLPSVIVKKKGRYFNKLSNQFISKNQADRIKKYFKKHPSGTLYEATGRPTYDKNKPWIEQSSTLHEIYRKRKIQVIKTKDVHGNDVYFNPLLNKKVSKERVKKAMRYDYTRGIFNIQLYRMSTNKQFVYHIISTKIERNIELHDDIDKLFHYLEIKWLPDAMRLIKEIHQKHRLSKIDSFYVVFEHDILLTNYGTKDNGVVTIMKGSTPDDKGMSDFDRQLDKARMTYHVLLNNYNLLVIKRIRILIMGRPNARTEELSRLRLGVYMRNGE